MGIVDRTPPTVRGNLGEYNTATKVASNTSVAFSGSNEGRAFLVENKSNVTIECSNGGTIAGTGLIAGEVYPIGVKKVTIASTGVVYVLR
tara:strand:- start:384 stop:653 length:270 start_codon:yes stop_codon:yes gene_type:complete